MSYQWQKNNIDIPGATLSYIDINEAGNYSVKAYCGTVFSISNIVIADALPLLTFYADTDIDVKVYADTRYFNRVSVSYRYRY